VTAASEGIGKGAEFTARLPLVGRQQAVEAAPGENRDAQEPSSRP
jgi:hypothetical protein